jgi:HEAT repeat protein
VSVKAVGATVALALALAAGGVRAAGEPTAQAKSKAKPVADAGKRSLPAARLDEARAALAGEDDAAAIAAAGALGASGAGNAAEPLVELLAAGAAPGRTEAALDALAKLGGGGGGLTAARAFDVLELYAGHHAPEVRLRAVRALGTIRDPHVVPTLLARLGDAAPGVRAAAGEALAARRERAGVARLFALVKRGDASAAAPLAALATPDLIPQVAELAGTVDDGVLATVLGEYAQRSDVPDRLRLDVIRTIARLAGAAATTALVEYVASVPAKDDRPSKREAQKLLDARESAR